MLPGRPLWRRRCLSRFGRALIRGGVLTVALLVASTSPAYADGAGSGADSVSSILIAADIGLIFWYLHLRRTATGVRRKLKWVLPPVVVLLVVGAVTASTWVPKSKPARIRPRSTAHIQILEPSPGEVIVGTKTTLRLNLIGARIVPPSQITGKLRSDQGHIHVFVDQLLISMTTGLQQQLTNLTPGQHTVTVEFVATDHGSFNPPVKSVVLFTVQAP